MGSLVFAGLVACARGCVGGHFVGEKFLEGDQSLCLEFIGVVRFLVTLRIHGVDEFCCGIED